MDMKNIGLLIIVAILIVAPLVMYNGHGEDDGYFGGTDDQGGEIIEKKQPKLSNMGFIPMGTT
jgi:cobalt/nickel transport protein